MLIFHFLFCSLIVIEFFFIILYQNEHEEEGRERIFSLEQIIQKSIPRIFFTKKFLFEQGCNDFIIFLVDDNTAGDSEIQLQSM